MAAIETRINAIGSESGQVVIRAVAIDGHGNERASERANDDDNGQTMGDMLIAPAS